MSIIPKLRFLSLLESYLKSEHYVSCFSNRKKRPFLVQLHLDEGGNHHNHIWQNALAVNSRNRKLVFFFVKWIS